MTRPFHDLRAGYLAQDEEILAAVRRVLESGRYILDREVEAFEREFAAWLGVPHVVGTSSATDALSVALLALDVRPGDEVIVPALTAAPTAMAVCAVGARPVLVDIDPTTFTLDPAALSAALSARTRVVVPVHLYGQCAPMDEVRDALAGRDVAVLEDASQAHGATDLGRPAGSLGELAAFSFYPTKNLGAFGDGGAVAGRDADLAARVRRLRVYGAGEGYDFLEPGRNARLDEVQAAILRVRLTRLDAANDARARHAARYREALADAPVALPAVRDGCRHAHHQFVVRSPRRDDLQRHLRLRGIETLVHYPRPLQHMAAFRGTARCSGSLAEAERAAAEVLSLPIYPELPDEHREAVIAAVASFGS